MGAAIHTIPLGIDNVYVVKDKGAIIIDSGEAFVGDSAMNKFPLRFSPGLPIYAEDVSALKKSWEKLLEKNVKTIYPAHGESFPVDIMREQVSRL